MTSQANIQNFDYSVDLLQSILWQYDKATHLLSLLNQKQTWYDINQTEFWQDWFNYVFYLANPNLTTNPLKEDLALFGLSVWGVILEIPIYVNNVPESSTKPIFGFNAYTSYPTLINTYDNFYGETLVGAGSNFSTKNQIIALSLAEQQFLLLLRYFTLTTRDNIMTLKIRSVDNTTHLPFYPASINDFFYFLCNLLGTQIGYTGTIYVLDNLNMTITYHFTASGFSVDLKSAISQLDLWPRPAGVAVLFS
jgi:Protein of unknown function (DUF2612)